MILIILGITMFGIAFFHRLAPLQKVEVLSVQALQNRIHSSTLRHVFQEIWFFGRTPFAVLILVLYTLLDWRRGFLMSLLFSLTVGLEYLFKRLVNRPRPFQASTDIEMLQPQQPSDPSFPSGDALRIWFLVLVLGNALGAGIAFWIGLSALAFLVSLGRLLLGVHYPSDVVAGAGMGLIGAGAVIWIWRVFNLL